MYPLKVLLVNIDSFRQMNKLFKLQKCSSTLKCIYFTGERGKERLFIKFHCGSQMTK